MAKLLFRYGAMNSGKSTNLIQVAHNYEELNHKVIIVKPAVDTKGDKKVMARIGLTRTADYLFDVEDSFLNLNLDGIAAILIDEVQFLTPQQIEQLWYIAKIKNVAVVCYGLKVSFNSYSFPGSIRLFELADELTELATICDCGVKARFIARKVNGEYQADGPQVVIDGADNVEYESQCGKCYIKKVKRCKL